MPPEAAVLGSGSAWPATGRPRFAAGDGVALATLALRSAAALAAALALVSLAGLSP
ncbi:hypothetical protein [Roseococcus sp. YIM B11640]|uniref:hypothetical protein n=1 Tax=Roseococcus sp. YIM B11640 TaxID=3133973 RepID=UPI003C7BFC03